MHMQSNVSKNKAKRIWFENNAESKPVYWKTVILKCLFLCLYLILKCTKVHFKKLWSKHSPHAPRDELLSARLFNNQFIFKIE